MEFIKKKENEPMIYMLGCLPFIQKPYDNYTNVMTVGIATHACIYTHRVIQDTLQKDVQDFIDWDYYTWKTYPRYMYHEPLCYQLFPETENQQNWDSFSGLTYILLYLFKLLELDKKPEPGYKFFYNTSKILYTFSVIFVVFAVLFLIHLAYVCVLQKYSIGKKIK